MLSRFASFAPAFKMQQPKMLSGGFFMQKLGINGSSQLSTTAESSNAQNFCGHIPVDEVQITYSGSSGPGGQHVNKAQTKVEVRFHVQSASWIPENLKPYIIEKESHRISKDGYFIIHSDKTRQQLLNQADCFERIRRMLRERLQELNKPEPSEEILEQIEMRRMRGNEKRLRVKQTISMTKAYRQKPSAWDM